MPSLDLQSGLQGVIVRSTVAVDLVDDSEVWKARGIGSSLLRGGGVSQRRLIDIGECQLPPSLAAYISEH